MTIVSEAVSTPIEAEPTGRPPGGRLGVLTTSLLEAQCWRGQGAVGPHLGFASGGDGNRAHQAAAQSVAEGVCGLVSFGLAAGLAPVSRPGDLIVAESVALPSGKSIRTDRGWREEALAALSSALIPAKVTRVAGRDRLLFTTAEKQRAFKDTFAAALDTESHVVAETAVAAGLPFLVVRAIVDPAETTRPFATHAALTAEGAWRGFAVAAQLCRRPWEAPAVWLFARDARAGLALLRRVAVLMPMPERTAAPALP